MQTRNWFDRCYTADKFYLKLSYVPFFLCRFSSLFSLSLPFDFNCVCVCVCVFVVKFMKLKPRCL
jgi:hypothetical protein